MGMHCLDLNAILLPCYKGCLAKLLGTKLLVDERDLDPHIVQLRQQRACTACGLAVQRRLCRVRALRPILVVVRDAPSVAHRQTPSLSSAEHCRRLCWGPERDYRLRCARVCWEWRGMGITDHVCVRVKE